MARSRRGRGEEGPHEEETGVLFRREGNGETQVSTPRHNDTATRLTPTHARAGGEGRKEQEGSVRARAGVPPSGLRGRPLPPADTMPEPRPSRPAAQRQQRQHAAHGARRDPHGGRRGAGRRAPEQPRAAAHGRDVAAGKADREAAEAALQCAPRCVCVCASGTEMGVVQEWSGAEREGCRVGRRGGMQLGNPPPAGKQASRQASRHTSARTSTPQ